MDPVVEAKDMFWSITRKAKSASKNAFKQLKKAVGIPTGPLSDSNPRYYLVMHPSGALVRETMELSSPQVYNLRQGDVVTCAEIIGRRGRLIDPVEGWVSLVSSANEVLMELTFPPDKKTQVQTMNRRFDKLKEQQKNDSSDSPIATPVVYRTAGPEISSSEDTMHNLKSKIVFKSNFNNPTHVPVPALAGPCSAASLLDFGEITTPEKKEQDDNLFSLL